MPATLTEQGVRDAISSVVERMPTGDLKSSEDFYDFGLDSLDHAQILMQIEEVFGVQIAEEDFDACRSIDAIIDYASMRTGPAC